MRLAFAYLALAIPFAPAQAGDISRDHRGTWTEGGDCLQARRIVIGEKTVTLVEPGRARFLTDGDESVFKGETLINASRPAKQQEDAVLAFSARLVDQNGEIRLVTEGLEKGGGFAGEYRLCKSAASPRTASRARAKQLRNAATRTGQGRWPPSGAFPAGPLLGGLY